MAKDGFVSNGFVLSNDEVVCFLKNYKRLIYTACHKAGLRSCDWDLVANEVAIKFAQDRLNYNPNNEKGTTLSTYIYKVSFNRAFDEARSQHHERYDDLDEKDWERLPDESDKYRHVDAHDEKVLVREAVRRLAQECRDKGKMAILLRYAVNGEERETIAKDFAVDNDYVSLVKNRWFPRLQSHLRKVLKEDEEGVLKLGDFSEIGYLKPYLNWK